jgi:hypothetical protein
MRLGLAGLALLLAAGQAQPESKKPERWLGVFAALPGARLLCTQHVLGQSEGKRVEIQFSLYATKRRPSETARFYAQAHAVPWKAGSETITVKAAEGRKLLTVHAVSAPHPGCGVEPDNADRTVIVVSEKVP